jgi:hypothetical protein
MLHQDSHLVPGNAVEIVGKVNQDLTVKVLKATDMGSNLGAFFGRRGIWPGGGGGGENVTDRR